MNAKTTKTTKTTPNAKQLGYMRRVLKEYGPVTAVLAVTQNYPLLHRADVMALAKAARVNKHTASRQYHVSRSGAVIVDLKHL